MPKKSARYGVTKKAEGSSIEIYRKGVGYRVDSSRS